jgi:hypothetical protein
MKFPILVEPHNGQFRASLLGSQVVRAEGATKEEAVAAVNDRLRGAIAAGDIVFLDLPTAPSILTHQPSPEEAEDWRQLCEEIYRERDAQKAAEFPE